jgi:hypothetical protein
MSDDPLRGLFDVGSPAHDEIQRLRGIERLHNVVMNGLLPLCPCTAGNPADWDGPQRECVVHGDGDTFVAEHRRLQAVERRVRERLDVDDLRYSARDEMMICDVLREVLEGPDA